MSQSDYEDYEHWDDYRGGEHLESDLHFFHHQPEEQQPQIPAPEAEIGQNNNTIAQLLAPELAELEQEEEAELDERKLQRARRKIQRIYQRANPGMSQRRLFRKFRHLVRSGNCQGAMVDAVWEEWQNAFHLNWVPYDHRVRELKAKMKEDQPLFERTARW